MNYYPERKSPFLRRSETQASIRIKLATSFSFFSASVNLIINAGQKVGLNILSNFYMFNLIFPEAIVASTSPGFFSWGQRGFPSGLKSLANYAIKPDSLMQVP
jgi:hypothetical protein